MWLQPPSWQAGSRLAIRTTKAAALPAHRSIIFDVFPRSADSRYFADMSRTVVRGRPSPELTKLYQTVKDAQEEAITKHSRRCRRRGDSSRHLRSVRKGWVQDRPGQRPHAGLLSRHGTWRRSRYSRSAAHQPNRIPLLQEGHVVTVEPGSTIRGWARSVSRTWCLSPGRLPQSHELSESV